MLETGEPDGEKWSEAVAADTFSNIENNPIHQRIKSKNTAEGRYIKLVSKSAVRQKLLVRMYMILLSQD